MKIDVKKLLWFVGIIFIANFIDYSTSRLWDINFMSYAFAVLLGYTLKLVENC